MRNTQDLSKFGYRDLEAVQEIIGAYLNTEILGAGVRIELHPSNGKILLIDEDYQVAMMNDHELERFYTLPYGLWAIDEGFKSDFLDTDPVDYHKDDLDYILTEIFKHPLSNDLSWYFEIIHELQEGTMSFMDLENNIDEWNKDWWGIDTNPF